ncbi:MAG: leucine-rich repeat domain-containing protein [Limisphaerales bacterium]
MRGNILHCRFSLALLLLLLLTLPAVVQAQSYTNDYGTWYYTTTNDSITITNYSGPGGDVTIPDRIPETTNGLPVTTIGAYYDSYGWVGAFDGCTSLTSITIPNSVTTIGNGVFEECTHLASITIPNSVTSIGNEAFAQCTNLNSITIPDSVTNIGVGVFMDCNNLTNATIGNSVTSIGDQAFYFCTALTSLTIGNSVTNIGFQSFYYCARLTSVTIPNSVTKIGQYAFEYCTSLNGVFFQGSAPSADTTVFSYDEYPTVFYLAGTTNWASTFAARPTLLWNPQVPYRYSTNNGTITITGYISGYTNSGGPVVMTIPTVINGLPVTTIGSTAFQYSTSLASVAVPNSITNIGSYAFAHCSSLTNVTIGSGVTSIGSWAFGFCTILHGAYFQGNAPSADTTVFLPDSNAIVYYLPGTTGWDNWVSPPPAVLWNPQVQTGDASFGVLTNGFGFTITGTSGLVIVVEACTNLANPTWSPVGTNGLTDGSSYFSDPQWTNYPARFYRLRSP